MGSEARIREQNLKLGGCYLADPRKNFPVLTQSCFVAMQDPVPETFLGWAELPSLSICDKQVLAPPRFPPTLIRLACTPQPKNIISVTILRCNGKAVEKNGRTRGVILNVVSL